MLAETLFLGANVANELSLMEHTQYLLRNFNYREELKGNYKERSFLKINFKDDNFLLPLVAGQVFKETLRTILAMSVASAFYESLIVDMDQIDRMPAVSDLKLRPYLYATLVKQQETLAKGEEVVMTKKQKTKLENVPQFRPFFTREKMAIQARRELNSTLWMSWSQMKFRVSQFITLDPLIFLLSEMVDELKGMDNVEAEILECFQLSTQVQNVSNILRDYDMGATDIHGGWWEQWQALFRNLQKIQSFFLNRAGRVTNQKTNYYSVPMMYFRDAVCGAGDILAHLNVHFFTIWSSSVFGLPGANNNERAKLKFNMDDYLAHTIELLAGSCNDFNLKQFNLYQTVSESLEDPSTIKPQSQKLQSVALDYFYDFMKNKRDYVYSRKVADEEIQAKEKREKGYVRFGSILWILHILRQSMEHMMHLFGFDNGEISPLYLLAHLSSVQTKDEWRYRQWIHSHHTNRSYDITNPNIINDDTMIVPLEPSIVSMTSDESISSCATKVFQAAVNRLSNQSLDKEATQSIISEDPASVIFGILEMSSGFTERTGKQKTINPMTTNASEYFTKVNTKDKKTLRELFYPFQAVEDDERQIHLHPFSRLEPYLQVTAGLSIDFMEERYLGNNRKASFEDAHVLHPTLAGHNGMSHLLQLYLFAHNMIHLLPNYIAELQSWITKENVGIIHEETVQEAVEFQRACIGNIITNDFLAAFNTFLKDPGLSVKTVISLLINQSQKPVPNQS